MEAAAELIVDAARRHRVQAPARDLEGARSPPAAWRRSSELDRHRLRELRRAAPAAVDRDRTASIGGGGRHLQGARGRQAPTTRSRLAAARSAPRPALAPRPRARTRRSDQARRTPSSTWRNDGMPWRGVSGKYVPPKNGLPVGRRGRRSSASRPGRSSPGPRPCTAASRSGRSSRSTLIATKCALRTRGGLLVLERLALHDVAPVAGRVADRTGRSGRSSATARARAPPGPTGTSPPGCGRAGAGRGSSRRRAGSSADGAGPVRPWPDGTSPGRSVGSDGGVGLRARIATCGEARWHHCDCRNRTRHGLARRTRVSAAGSSPTPLAAKETDRWITGFA